MKRIAASDPKTIGEFFGEPNKPFLIPEYQCPYEWETEEIVTLFNDIHEFEGEEYFLGTIMYFENTTHQREIVDGQQRIISLFLLIRAMYERLKNTNWESDLKKLIWEFNDLGDIISPDSVLISSQAISDEANQTFINILATGKADASDLYSKNYREFQKLLSNLDDHLIMIFRKKLLELTTILPIKADDFNSTLILFERINDRGRQLTDSDIFKSKIYTRLDEILRREFIARWKLLERKMNIINEPMITLFNHYMYFARARDNRQAIFHNDGVRNYFLDRNFDALQYPTSMNYLEKIFKLIRMIKTQNTIDGESWSQNIEIRKALDIVRRISSEWWDYAVSVYYLAPQDEEDFESNFTRFLHKLISSFAKTYSIKSATTVRKLMIDINFESMHYTHPSFSTENFSRMEISKSIQSKSKPIQKMWMSIFVYANQDELLPMNCVLELILPRKNSYNPEDKELVETIGNFTPLEKEFAQTKNKSFEEKKSCYQKSGIIVTRNLIEKSSWSFDEIQSRNEEIVDQILAILDKWDSEY